MYPLLKNNKALCYLLLSLSPPPTILFPITPPWIWICLNYWLASDLSAGRATGGWGEMHVGRWRENGGWAAVRPLTLGQLWARPQRPGVSMFSFSFSLLSFATSLALVHCYHRNLYVYNKMLKSLQEIRINLSERETWECVTQIWVSMLGSAGKRPPGVLGTHPALRTTVSLNIALLACIAFNCTTKPAPPKM